MAKQVAGFAYWISTLVAECELPVRDELPKEKRRLFRELARFLLDNEFDDVTQIHGMVVGYGQLVSSSRVRLGGVDPSKWIGGSQFTNSDLDVIRAMMRRGRSRSPVKQVCIPPPPR